MKDGSWWVEPGILTVENDPSSKLALAADQFGDEYVPMVFMTGDGHRRPAFQWTTRGNWPNVFNDLIADGKVCCYIEKFPNEVNAGCVPLAFAPVHQAGKVFGWEPDVFRTIGEILEDIIGLRTAFMMKKECNQSDLVQVLKAMYRVRLMGYLIYYGNLAMLYHDIVRSKQREVFPEKVLPAITDFLKEFADDAMDLRTGIHPVIAAKIQQKIDQYPDHAHLISCGDAHVYVNPLYRFIRPAVGTFGVADQNSF